MLTQEAKNRAQAVNLEEEKAALKAEIEQGISAERLSISLDWKRLKADVEKVIADFEVEKVSLYVSIIRDAATTEAKIQVVDKIRYRNQEMENFKYIIGLVESRARRGHIARRELDKIEEGQS